MPAKSQGGGRSAQKERTRSAIVDAARRLPAPTIEQAADAAGVSRATAYRYFPTQDALAVELDRVAYWRDIDALVDSTATLEIGERLERVIDATVAKVVSEERHVRQALLVYHATWLRDGTVPVRRGGRMAWIEMLIAPLPPRVLERLRYPLALAIGPDQITMLKDVARLAPADVARVLKWSAAALLRVALTEAGGDGDPESGETPRKKPRT
jgi:AcrR family transcriptional regulator